MLRNQRRNRSRHGKTAERAFRRVGPCGNRAARQCAGILRALWELEPEPLGFPQCMRRMGTCSSSMLSGRLQQLQSAGMVEKRPDKSYAVTVAGMELCAALQHVWDWSEPVVGTARSPVSPGGLAEADPQLTPPLGIRVRRASSARAMGWHRRRRRPPIRPSRFVANSVDPQRKCSAPVNVVPCATSAARWPLRRSRRARCERGYRWFVRLRRPSSGLNDVL